MLNDKIKLDIENLAKSTRVASLGIAKASSEEKNNILSKIVLGLDLSRELILEANKEDIASVQGKDLD